jgi:hypothetical protein
MIEFDGYTIYADKINVITPVEQQTDGLKLFCFTVHFDMIYFTFKYANAELAIAKRKELRNQL